MKRPSKLPEVARLETDQAVIRKVIPAGINLLCFHLKIYLEVRDNKN